MTKWQASIGQTHYLLCWDGAPNQYASLALVGWDFERCNFQKKKIMFFFLSLNKIVVFFFKFIDCVYLLTLVYIEISLTILLLYHKNE